MSIEASIFLALAVLLGNSFFVGAEFALVSARRSNIELKALNGSRAAKITLNAMEHVSLMLAGAQLGVTLCSLIFGAVAEPLVAYALKEPFHVLHVPEVFVHPVSFAVALAVMVYLHVVVGEMVPKNLSLAASTKAALILVPPLWFVVKLVRPVVVTLNAIANATVRLLGVRPRQEIRSSFSRDEVAGFVKESHREGLLSEEEEHLLSSTLDFEDRRIKHVVLPLEHVVTSSIKPTALEVETLSAKTGFSRFPVPNTRGGLKGYVHLKDILYLPEGTENEPLPARLIRPLGNVRVGSSLRDALATMQQTGSHIAQVTAGRRGKLVGVVMLEDVLEELVGTIRDETRKN
jgi:CBS domain containing-hemolysin-like protein